MESRGITQRGPKCVKCRGWITASTVVLICSKIPGLGMVVAEFQFSSNVLVLNDP